MNSKTLRLFIGISAIFILFAVISWFIKAYKLPPELKSEREEIKSETGISHRIADFKGYYVLVCYFQTWCGDCIEELASIDALQTKVGKDRIKVLMITDEGWKKIIHFKDKYCNTLDYYQSTTSLNSMNIRVFPTTYLLDKDGKILMSKIQSFDWSSNEVLQRIK